MSGKNTALIDADLRKPSMNLFFDGKYGGKLPLNRFLCGTFHEKQSVQLHGASR